MAIPSWVLRCPRLLFNVDKKTGNVYWFWAPCDNDLCAAGCAEARAEDQLMWACRVFPRFRRIWIATIPNDENATERLRKRRHRMKACGCLWAIQDHGKTLHIYATEDLSKSKSPPTTGEWVSPSVALDHLLLVSLALPGRGRLQWAGLWERPAQARREGRSFALGEQPQDLMDAAVEEAEVALRRSYPGGREDLSEDEVESVWLPLVLEAIEHQWTLRKNANGEDEE